MATRKPKTDGGAVRRKTGSVKNGSRKNGQVFPTVEQIRIRAYELYLGRGANYGDEVADWLNAERELMEFVKSAAD